jgi:hypothetical protein
VREERQTTERRDREKTKSKSSRKTERPLFRRKFFMYRYVERRKLFFCLFFERDELGMRRDGGKRREEFSSK